MTHKHPTKISYEGSFEKLVEEIGDLRYDALADFLDLFSKKIFKDGEKDAERGRGKLSTSLFDASQSIDEARVNIERALKISKPFMQEEFDE